MTAGIKDYINKDGDTNTYAYNESQTFKDLLFLKDKMRLES